MEPSKENTAAPKTAFLFPGHTVKLGMGGLAPGLTPAVKALYALGEKIFGRDLTGLMAGGPLEELRRTLNAQPAVFLAALAPFFDLAELGVRPAVAAGRSLGDFTAVTAAGALTVEAALEVVKRRSEIFERAIARNPGRMSVFLGITEDQARRACSEAAAEAGGTCVVAGVNTDSNFVVSGTHAAVAAAERAARKLGAHIMDIAMPGPFHSPLMKEAEQEFGEYLEGVKFGEPAFPVVDDRSPSGFVQGASGIRAFLISQISTAVDWRLRAGILRTAGVSVICELGPSQGMARITAASIPGCAWREVADRPQAADFAAAARAGKL
jgi:[acyl-carrier-protein] S-malonyltransferase